MSDKPPNRTSLELLLSVRKGDSGAQAELLDRYRPILFRMAHRRLPRAARDLVSTQDIVQETLMRSLKHVKNFEYRQEGAFQAYLHQALRNRIRDEIRRVARKPLSESIEDQGGDDPSPLEELIGKDTLERFERAFERLESEDQQAIVARIEWGLSHAEVAEALGKSSPDAARMAVSRALVRLAKEMSDVS